MTSVIDGTRFARAAATRQAILDAATDLFCRNGYRFVSLRDIAAEAGITHPALLKHFAGKEELLGQVARRLDASAAAAATPPDALPFAATAHRQDAVRGHAPLFAALTGEASAPSHPLHEWMRDRAAELRARRAEALAAGVDSGLVAADRSVEDEALRLTAAWDGLRMLQQYLPDRVDVAATLERHQELIARPLGWREPGTHAATHPLPPAPPLPPIAEEPSAAETGYRTGRERRAKIVDGAMALFAREGYGDTSLLDIATRVGVSKSALYHHFSSKDALLHEVMRERDRRIDDRGTPDAGASAADVLRSFADGAATNEAEQPGLIELYAVISSEATPPTHDAHAYFKHRFAVALDGFATLLRAAADDGVLPPHRDPDHEALWLLALWDGLQYQWLYDHDTVDVAAQLRAHFADILPETRS
ncbi:TetR family transcriptional regulator [Cryocola sp. 340MFSha3.1]|uniref:TetR/AcrR family transcriptional regulator n=1 Tax=Cryocola sp. 340MFSha3.1 TaxID=1169145 RepID=UPI0003A5036A|nr:TetR family transcriptional regulator [Cryocola sp. 340MFSha3.1]